MEDFLKIINEVKIKNKESKNYYIDNNFTKDELYIKIDSENIDLKLNIAFTEFFKKELYSNVVSKEKTQPVLASIIDNSKPLSATNLQKDLNEEIVELI